MKRSRTQTTFIKVDEMTHIETLRDAIKSLRVHFYFIRISSSFWKKVLGMIQHLIAPVF